MRMNVYIIIFLIYQFMSFHAIECMKCFVFLIIDQCIFIIFCCYVISYISHTRCDCVFLDWMTNMPAQTIDWCSNVRKLNSNVNQVMNLSFNMFPIVENHTQKVIKNDNG